MCMAAMYIPPAMYTYVHGGDIYTASGKKNLADYSANINPLGLPQSVKKAIVKSIAGCADYPDPFCRRLTEKLAGFFQQRCSRCTV